MHEELASEAEDDGVESDECEIGLALAILRRLAGRGVQRVGEEDAVVEGVRGGGIDGVETQDQEHEDQWVQPGVSEGDAYIALEEAACFATLRCSCRLLLCRCWCTLRESCQLNRQYVYKAIDIPAARRSRSREHRLPYHLVALLQDC